MVDVVAAAEPGGQGRGQARIAAPEPADVVAINPVPDRPARAAREALDLVHPGGVPGLRDHLGVGQQRIFGDRLDHRRLDHHLAPAEPEAVDVGLGDHVPQAGEDQGADDRMVAVDRVAAAGVVEEAALLVEEVIKAVVEPAEVEGRPLVVPFGRVVEDDVEHDLDPGGVERLDHPAELLPGGGVLGVAGIGRLGRAEGDRVVAPEVAELLAGQRVDERAVVLVELVDRQQLDGRHPQRLQVGDLLDQAGVGARVPHAGRGVPADVQLVEDRVLAQDAPRVEAAGALDLGGRAPPVDQAAAGDVPRHAPGPAARQGARRRVEQDDARVVEVPDPLRPVHAIAVAELVGQAGDPDMPVVARPVPGGVERDLGGDLRAAMLGEDQRDRRPVPADQGEVDAVRGHARPQRERVPSRHDQEMALEREQCVRRGVIGHGDAGHHGTSPTISSFRLTDNDLCTSHLSRRVRCASPPTP